MGVLLRRGPSREEKADDSTMQTQDIMEDALMYDAHLVRLQKLRQRPSCYMCACCV